MSVYKQKTDGSILHSKVSFKFIVIFFLAFIHCKLVFCVLERRAWQWILTFLGEKGLYTTLCIKTLKMCLQKVAVRLSKSKGQTLPQKKSILTRYMQQDVSSKSLQLPCARYLRRVREIRM